MTNFSNIAEDTNFASSITDAETSKDVDSATGWPEAPFNFRVEDEVINVGTKSGVTFSDMTRGYDGTTAVAHTTTPTVKHVVIAEDVSSLRETYLDAVGAYSVVHRYDFDEASGDVLDKVGVIDLVVSGGVTREVASLVGTSALLLDGADGRAVASAIGNMPVGNTDRTIIVIYKRETKPTAQATFLSYGTWAATRQYWGMAYHGASDNRVNFNTWSSDLAVDWGGSDTKWIMAAMGYTADRVLFGFQNGIYGTRLTTGDLITGTSPLTIGRTINASEYANIAVDSVVVFDEWIGTMALQRIFDTTKTLT